MWGRGRALLQVVVILTLAFTGVLQAMENDAGQGDLSGRLDAIFDDADFSHAFWGVRVERMDGTVLYDRNGGRLFTPASATKLFTTAAALHHLGPDFTYRTTLEAVGELDDDGVLRGHLVITGSGDPSLGTWRLEDRASDTQLLSQWVDAIAGAGIRHVDGHIIGDGRVYTEEYYSGDWELEDLPFWYAAGTAGLNFRENVFHFTTAPAGRVGEVATVTMRPATGYVRSRNDVLTIEAGGPRTADIIHRPLEANTVTYGGTIPLDSEPFEQRGNVWDAEKWTATLLMEAMSRRGITVTGRARNVRELGDLPEIDAFRGPQRRLLAEVTSPNSLALVRLVNKTSHNLYADALLRTMGARVKGRGDFATGASVVEEWARSIGVPDMEHFQQLDGSGLARRNIIQPRQFTHLLRHMDSQPTAEEFRRSLPTAGLDDGWREGWKNEALRERVFAKTGFIGNVRALCGYLETGSGERLVFAAMCNNSMLPLSRLDRAIDTMCLELVSASATP